jgi:hypothetical protein
MRHRSFIELKEFCLSEIKNRKPLSEYKLLLIDHLPHLSAAKLTKIEHINKKQNTKSRALTPKHTHKDITQNRCFIALDKGQ